MGNKIWIPKLNYYSKRLSMWQEKLWNEVNSRPFMGIIDNIAGRKTFEYATFGRSGVQQANSKLLTMRPEPIVMPPQQMTSVGCWNASNAILNLPALTTNIDRAARTYDADSSDTYTAYGFAFDNNNPHGMSAFGDMDDQTYTDASSTTQTVRSMYDTETGGSGGGDVYFSLDGTSLTDSDVTWLDFTWDNTASSPITTDRSADMESAVESNSDTYWRDLTPSSTYENVDSTTDFVLTTS